MPGRSGRTAGVRRSKRPVRATHRRRRSAGSGRRIPGWVLWAAAAVVLLAGIFAAVAMLGESGVFGVPNAAVLVGCTALAVVLALAARGPRKRRR